MNKNDNYYRHCKDLRLFIIKYLSATNTLDNRIVIIDTQYNTSVVINHDYNTGSFGHSIVYEYLLSIGIKCTHSCILDDNRDAIMTDDFKTPLK